MSSMIGNFIKHLPPNRPILLIVNDVIVDPAKVRTLKIHLIDEEDTNLPLEVNVDNTVFKEIL